MSVFGNRSVHGNLSSSGITRGDVTLWDGIEPQGLIVTSNPKPLFDIGKYGMDTDGEGVWVVSGYNTSLRRNQSLRSTNNGVTWIELPDGINGNLGTDTRTRLSMPVIYVIHSKTGVWLSLTCENRLGRSTNNGKTWKNLPPSTQTSSSSGSGLPVQHYQKMVALATDNKGTWININEKGVYKSTNDGEFFHKVANVDRYMNPGDYSNSNYCDLYTDDGNKWIYVTKGGQFFSTNGGSTWTKYPTGLYPGAKNQTYYRLTGNGKGKIIATGKPYAAVSNDNGRTWTKLSMVFYGSSSYFFPYNIVTNKNGYWIILPWASTWDRQYSVAIPNHSFDDGNTWYPMTNTLGRYFYHLTQSSSVSTWKNCITQYDAYGPIRIGADNKIIVTGSSGLFGTNFPISLNSIPSLVFKNCGKSFGGMSSSVLNDVTPKNDAAIHAFDYDGHQTIILGQKKGYTARSDDGGLTWKKMIRGFETPNCKNDFTISKGGSRNYSLTIGGGPATSNYYINLILKVSTWGDPFGHARDSSYGKIMILTGMTKEQVAKKIYDEIILDPYQSTHFYLPGGISQNTFRFELRGQSLDPRHPSSVASRSLIGTPSLFCEEAVNEFTLSKSHLTDGNASSVLSGQPTYRRPGSTSKDRIYDSKGVYKITIKGGPATHNYKLQFNIVTSLPGVYTGAFNYFTPTTNTVGQISITVGMTKEQVAKKIYDLSKNYRNKFKQAFYDGTSDFMYVLVVTYTPMSQKFFMKYSLTGATLKEYVTSTPRPPLDKNITSIATDRKGVWIAVMAEGYAARSANNGINWNKLPRGLKITSSGNVHVYDFKQIVTDRKGVWIAYNQQGYFARSIDNGINWKQITTTNFQRYIYSSRYGPRLATDCNGVWIIAGYYGEVLRSTNNGATWVQLPKASGAQYFQAIATDEAGTWVILSLKKDIFISRDNGATWNKGPICGGHAYNKLGRYGRDYDYFTFQTLITNKKGFWMIIPEIGAIGVKIPSGALPTLVSTDNAHTWHEGPAWLGVGGKFTHANSESNYRNAICVNDKILISSSGGLGMNV